MIYLIAANDLGCVKIGWAENPMSRLVELQTGCPAKLSIVAAFDWPKEFERRLHEIFAEDRRLGEWFAPTPDGRLDWWLRGISDERHRELTGRGQ